MDFFMSASVAERIGDVLLIVLDFVIAVQLIRKLRGKLANQATEQPGVVRMPSSETALQTLQSLNANLVQISELARMDQALVRAAMQQVEQILRDSFGTAINRADTPKSAGR